MKSAWLQSKYTNCLESMSETQPNIRLPLLIPHALITTLITRVPLSRQQDRGRGIEAEASSPQPQWSRAGWVLSGATVRMSWSRQTKRLPPGQGTRPTNDNLQVRNRQLKVKLAITKTGVVFLLFYEASFSRFGDTQSYFLRNKQTQFMSLYRWHLDLVFFVQIDYMTFVKNFNVSILLNVNNVDLV